MIECVLINIVAEGYFGLEPDVCFGHMLVPVASLSPAHLEYLKRHGDGKPIDGGEPEPGEPARDFWDADSEGGLAPFPGARMSDGIDKDGNFGGVPRVMPGECVVAYYRLFFCS